MRQEDAEGAEGERQECGNAEGIATGRGRDPVKQRADGIDGGDPVRSIRANPGLGVAALVAIDPATGDILALVALGEVSEARGDKAQAMRAYGSIIDLFPSRADLRRFAGERLERVGEKPGESVAHPPHVPALAERGARDGADGGVHARGVAAAGEHCDVHG